MEEKVLSNLLLHKGTKVCILIVVLAYFAVAFYWLTISISWAFHLVNAYNYYQEMTRSPWWTLLFYSSELGGVVGSWLRWIAGLFAIYSAVIFYLKGENALTSLRKPVGLALIFEGGFFLTLTPSVILGFIFPFTENIWYFEITPPGLIVFLVNGLACFAMVLIIPSLLFTLRSKIVNKYPIHEIVKLCCFTGIAYLFVVFWFNYLLAWAASLIRWPARAQPGIEILYSPVDFAHFSVTVFGLLLVAVLGIASVFPAIKGKLNKINVKLLGITMIGLSVYFILILGLYFLAGGYSAHPTVWAELLGPKHNPDFWCIAFIPLGLLLLKSKS